MGIDYYPHLYPISDEQKAAALRVAERHGGADVAWMLGVADYPPLPCGHSHEMLRNRPCPNQYAPVEVECTECGARWKKSRGMNAARRAVA